MGQNSSDSRTEARQRTTTNDRLLFYPTNLRIDPINQVLKCHRGFTRLRKARQLHMICCFNKAGLTLHG